MKSVLSAKVQEKELIVVDKFQMDAPKTKEFVQSLKKMGAANKALVIAEGADNNVLLSARNIAGVKTATVGTMNVYDILKYDSLILTKEALDKIVEVYN